MPLTLDLLFNRGSITVRQKEAEFQDKDFISHSLLTRNCNITTIGTQVTTKIKQMKAFTIQKQVYLLIMSTIIIPRNIVVFIGSFKKRTVKPSVVTGNKPPGLQAPIGL